MGVTIITDLDSTTFDRVDEIDSSTSHKAVMDCIHELKHKLCIEKEVVCLCAPQMGFNLRLFVVKGANRDYTAFLNPMVVNKEGLHLSRETNPSFPGKTFIVPRYDKIHVAYQTPDGHVDSNTYTGAFAEVIQQMIEMLDGILLTDYALDLDDVGGVAEFDAATPEDKQSVIEMYLNHLKANFKALSAEIDANPEMKLLSDTIKFNQGLLDGSIVPLDKEGNEVTAEYIENKNASRLAELAAAKETKKVKKHK